MPRKEKQNSEDKPTRRITVRDIAKEVGLHFTTVSEALRGSPRIKESTRNKVVEAAERMGYRPDPVLSALSSYRSSQLRSSFQGVLAWINGIMPNQTFIKDKSFYNDCYQGALNRSKALGYNLELFWVGDSKMTGKRISQILKNRNIVGVIVGPMPKMLDHFYLEWENFTSVRIGYSLKDDRLTNVISDQFQNTRRAFEKVYNDGFRRIGFVCPEFLDSRVNNKFLGGYLSLAYPLFGKPPVPLFMDKKPEGDEAAFLDWYERYKPEVILAGGRSLYYRSLVDAGVKIPRDVQLVSLHAEHLKMPIAGIYQNGNIVGASSVDHLVSMIQGFKTGLETFPKTTMVQGQWIDGESYDPTLVGS